ncbi:MAG: hypothetical protein P1U68_09765 [Verrucomicrobiales bacterium]|nr:hypothetical protein [Verrucomicrobiales bacterium]
MTRPLVFLLFGAFALQLSVTPVQAGRFSKCECVGDYQPPRGVVKWYTVKKKKEWEYRHHCLPCGRKIPYKVQVITYVDRYSDGTKRTWKCDVAGSEVTLGK